jgi:hypothetical protein
LEAIVFTESPGVVPKKGVPNIRLEPAFDLSFEEWLGFDAGYHRECADRDAMLARRLAWGGCA